MLIFGAGYPRTGTTTLNGVLLKLGYKTRNFTYDLITDPLNPPRWEGLFDRWEAVIGYPAAHWAIEIWEAYRCKVILTLRNADDWFDSMVWLAENSEPGWEVTNEMFFGSGQHDRSAWTQWFEKRNQQIIDTIPERDLLVFDICGGDGWDKLCSFLYEPFPSTNERTSNKWITREKDIAE